METATSTILASSQYDRMQSTWMYSVQITYVWVLDLVLRKTYFKSILNSKFENENSISLETLFIPLSFICFWNI